MPEMHVLLLSSCTQQRWCQQIKEPQRHLCIAVQASWREGISADPCFIFALQLQICHLPLTWTLKYAFALLTAWYQLTRARPSPPVHSCVPAGMRSISLIYTKNDLAFKADKLSVLTQPFSEWSLTICCWEQKLSVCTCSWHWLTGWILVP